ncbi:MAG: sugar phosphate nucleotidyltransferase [Ilumatobacteraceae bacterium]
MRKSDPSASLEEGQAKVASLGMKGMIPIGRPFMDYLLSAVADAGYKRVCLVIGPEHGAVERYYTVDSPVGRLELHFAIQEKPLGTADAVLAAEDFCGNEPFIVLNSDNYYPSDVLRKLSEATAPAIAAFARSALVAGGNVMPDRVTRFGALTIDDAGYLLSIMPRPGDDSRAEGDEIYASMNCWLFDSQIFDACRRVPLSPRNELELPRAVQLGIDTMGMRFTAVRVAAAVLDLSTQSDIAEVQRRLSDISITL